MKPNFKRLMAMLLSVVMIAGLMPTVVFADDGGLGDSVIIVNDEPADVPAEEVLPEDEQADEQVIPVEGILSEEVAAVAEGNVAKVGDIGYNSLKAAVADANADDTIVLLSDLADVDVTINKNITLDLGGKTITDAYIKIEGDVTIKNGSIKNVEESYPLVVNKGTLTVEDVAIEASMSDRTIWLRNSGTTLNFNSSSILATKGANNSYSTIYGVWVCKGATANINGGSITVDAGADATAVAIFGNYVNTVNVTDGKISTSGKNYSYAIWTEGAVNVSGGEIVTNENKYGYSSGVTYGYNYAINTKGEVTISGGEITTNGPSGYLVNAGGSNQEIAISNVKFTNVLTEVDKTTGGHSAPNLIKGSSVSAEITSGEFSGVSEELLKGTDSTLTITGGSFDVIDEKYVEIGATITVGGKDMTKTENGLEKVEYAAQVGETKYTTLEEAIVAAAPDGTVELLSDVTVDKWIMFSQRLTIGSGQIITLDMDGLTINGNNHTLTVNSVESATNGDRLFHEADNLNIKDLTIKYAEGVVGGINLKSGELNNVTFNGGVGVLPGEGDITITGCIFKTSGSAIYNETERNNLTVTGNTFNTAEGQYAIYLRGNTTFTDNTVVSGKVNVVSGSPVVTGNNFGDERFKVYNEATATISNNTINNLVFNDDSAALSTFTKNTLSETAQAALDAVAPVARIGNTGYTSLEEAFKAATSGCTIDILSDVVFEGDWDDRNTGAKFTVPVTINGNDKTIKIIGSLSDTNGPFLFKFEADATVNNLNIDISEVTNAKATAISSKADIIIDGCDFIGNGQSSRGVRFGEGAGANIGEVDATIINSTFTNFARGITDNENGQDANTVTITGNTVNNASVYVSATETVTFTGNKVSGGYVDIRSYTAADSVKVTATDNTIVGEDGVISVNPENITTDKGFATPAAKVGGKYYLTLADAFKKAADGDTITLLDPIVVAAGEKLELNKAVTITYTSDVMGEAMITNNGELTISGNGKIVYTYTGAADSSYGKGNYTIANNGKLTIDGATVENATAAMKHASYAINNGNGGSVVIESGSVINTNNCAIRQFGKGSITVNGGEVKGTRAVWLQAPGSNTADAPEISLTVNGGKLTGTGETGFKLAVYSYTYGNSLKNVSITVSGGEIDGDIALSGGDNKTVAETVTITGGTITDVYSYAADDVAGETVNISGGTFTKAPANAYLAPGYSVYWDNDKQIFGIEAKAVANVGGVNYSTLQKAVEAAKANEVIYLICSNANSEDVQIPADKTITIDLKGYTFSGSILAPNANLTITDSSENNTGSIKNTNSGASAIEINAGELTLTNVNIDSARHAVRIDGAVEATIDGGTYRTVYVTEEYTIQITQHVINVSGNANVIIKDGTFIGPKGSHTDSGAAINVQAGSTVTINGGSFSKGKNNTLSAKGTLSVIGGTFDQDPTAFVANGYVAKKNANTNLYEVVKCLKGSGTETDPYQIATVEDLIHFRDSVNAGETRHNAPGVWIALGADIDMAGENWVAIGSANIDHGFMGNFDGKTYTIKNLTITNSEVDSDDYVYAGFFGVTEGTDKDNQNIIKNLTIENVTISSEGQIVAAAIAYPYYTKVDNIKVCGDIAIKGGNYTAGVLAYTRLCTDASNLTVSGNEGSYITGATVVGGVISDIQMNHSLTANYSNFSASGLTITGDKCVGGISGIIASQTLNGASVENVTLNCEDARVGIVSGSLGGASTISNVTVENVTGATAIIGGAYNGGAAVQAKIGDTYYKTFADAYAAAQPGDTITLLAPIVVAAGEKLELDKAVTITYTSNVPGEDMITNRGTLVVDGATLVYTNTDITASNVTVSTISAEPGSVTEIKSGVVQNNSANNGSLGIYAYALDILTNGNLGDVTATISGGKVISTNYMAIRQFNNGAACKNTLNVTGGKIYGAKRAIQVHMDNQAAYTAISNGVIGSDEGGYALCFLTTSENISVTGGEFTGAVWYSGEKGIISGGTYNEELYEGYIADGFKLEANSDGTYGVVVDPAYGMAAKIGDTYYATLAAAIEASKPDDTIDLLADVNVTEVILIDKSLTINGNGNKVTSSASRVFRVTASDVEVTMNDVNVVSTVVRVGTNDVRGISVDPSLSNIKLTLNNCSVDFTDASANDWAYAVNVSGSGTGHTVTVDGGTYEGANVINVHGANNTIVVKNATLTSLYPDNDMYCGACIWVLQEQGSSVEATGNTFNGSNAVAFSLGEGTEITESNNTDNTTYVVAKVGDTYYTSLVNAFNNASDGDIIKLLQDVELSETVKVTTNVTLDLNGKTITGTDNATASFALIEIQPGKELTINDDEDGTGKITLKATNNRGWNAYSTVISNQRGKLTVEGGTIEHLGGTDMAYGIDNLTNTGAQIAETVINGGTVKSTYRAIRQFLNSSAEGVNNILTVNGGTIEGANKSIWMQDANKNANSGTLTVGENATLKGDVYLFVTEGSTEWPVEVSIAAAAIAEGSTVVTGNIPSGYAVTLNNGTYGVESGMAASVTNSEGVAYFDTLADAVAAAQDGDTVTLIADVALTESLVLNTEGTITIDGAGHKITQAAGYVDKQNGLIMLGATTYGDAETATHKYTIENVVFDGITGWSVIRAQGVTLTMDGCTIQNCNHTNGQALLRLDYTEATIKNTSIKNNTALMAITHNFNGDSSNSKLTVDNCVIEGNTFNKTAAIYYVVGGGCVINDSEFVGNKVNCNTNGAVIYLGFQEDCTVTGNLFKDNVVADATTSTRVAGAIFFGFKAEISGNAFVNNTASNANGDVLGQVCTSTYYDCDIDLSGNYWGGEAPVYGKDYTVQHQSGDASFALNTYNASYTLDENGNVVVGDVTPINNVAQVGKFGYKTITEAIDAAKDGETIVVLSDVVLTETLTIPAGKAVEIGLGDFNITYTSDVQGEAMITNNGELTLSGNGKIVYTYTGAADSNYGKGNYTIANNGKLTIDGVTVENATASMKHAFYAITNGNGGEIVLKKGLVLNTNNYAVRMFGNGSLTVEDGEIKGTRAVWMQAPGSNTADAPKISLTVKGGKLTATGESSDYKLAVYSYTYGNSLENVSITVNGGELEGDIALSGGANKTVAEKVTITGGTITDVYSYAADEVAGETVNISGGTFANKPADAYAAPGFKFEANTNGTYGVVVDPAYGKVAKIGETYYATIAEAIDAAKDGDVIDILPGTYDEVVKVAKLEKSITIQGAADFGTTLTGGINIGVDDHNNDIGEITIEGINFTGNGISLRDLAEVTVKNNKFSNIDGASAIYVQADNYTANTTISGNVINTTADAGIRVRSAMNITIDGNIVSGTANNSITLESALAANNGTVTITNNELSDWANNEKNEGRAIRIANGSGTVESKTVTIEKNVMTADTNATEEYVKITGLESVATISVNANYWDGKNPTDEGILSAACDPENYYADADLTELVEIEVEEIVSVTGRSLLLEDIVQVKYYFGFDPAIESSITTAGMYIWDNEADAKALNFANAIWHNTEIRDEGTYNGKHEYSFRSDGIPAKEMGDLQYVVGYIVVDGKTHYTTVEEFSPKAWCEIKKNDPTEKDIAAALMNYGAAAQVRFDYKTDSLMNEGFGSYTFTTDMLTNTTRVKGAELNGFKENGFSLVLEGTIQYKVYYAAAGLSGKSGFGIEYQVGDGEVETIEGFEVSGSEYFVKIEDIAAKDLDQTVTIKPFYTQNGERVYGNESKFSAETWIYLILTSTSTDATVLKDKEIAPALGNYILVANQRFADK